MISVFVPFCLKPDHAIKQLRQLNDHLFAAGSVFLFPCAQTAVKRDVYPKFGYFPLILSAHGLEVDPAGRNFLLLSSGTDTVDSKTAFS